MLVRFIVVGICLFGNLVSCRATNEIHHRIRRNGNSYKDPVGKGGSDTGRTMAEMMEKVDRINSKIDKLELHMKKTAEILNYWTETAGLEGSVYWKETSGCGGIIEAQSGRIIGKSKAMLDREECMWIIQAGDRYRIKLTLRSQNPTSSTEDYMSQCQVQEVKLNYAKSNDTPAFAKTSVTEDKTYVFRGPLIFLTCQCAYNNFKKQFVEFEGIGPRIFSRVHFQHLSATNLTGFYNVMEELNKGASQLLEKDVSFITVALPGLNFDKSSSMKNVLLQSISPEFCKSSSLSMHFDFALPTTTSIDCCKVDCLKHKFLVTKGYCVVTIGVNISTVFESNRSNSDYLNLVWDIQEHSKLKPRTVNECGSVISGRSSGVISESFSGYLANSRCIWIIHPFPKTEITVSITQLLIEEEHEHLFAVAVNDNAEIAITRFTEVSKYELSGRVILIVFYSDTSLQLNGFALNWETKADSANMSIFTNDDKLYRYTSSNGSANWNLTMPPSWPGLHIGVINHFASYQPYSYDINLVYALQGSAKFLVFGSTNGTFNVLVNATGLDSSTSKVSNFTSYDGVFLIIAQVYKPQCSIIADFEWNRGKAVAPTSYSACGGRIEPADVARIDFKTGKSFGTNTRCTWLIECRSTTVTFHLIKSGLKKNGIISIDMIDIQTGKILNGTKRIDTSSGDVAVSGPLILLTFKGSPSLTSETGFEIQYKGTGDKIVDNKTVAMRHWSTLSSTIEYPLNDDVPTSNDLFVFGQNPDGTKILSSTDKLIVRFLSHAMKNNTVTGQGYNFMLYSATSWNNSNTFQPIVDCTIVTGSLEDECNFTPQYSFADFHSKSETFDIKLNYSAFLAIVKPLDDIQSSLSREFELTWNLGGCGGLIAGVPNGKIEYKMHQYYTSSEDCIWLVDGTKFGATSISFSLEASGVLERDYLNIHPIYTTTGIVGVSTRLRYETASYSYVTVNRNVTVSSGVALITFRSSLSYSLTGTGFRISYALKRTRTKITESAGKSFVLIPNLASSEIALPLTKRMTSLNMNDTVIMFFNSPHGSSTSTTTTLNITIDELNLFVNDKTCTSDTLFFYYYSYSSFYLDESFRSFKNPEATCEDTITTVIDSEEYVDVEVSVDDEATAAPIKKTVKNTCNPQCYETNVLSTLTPARKKFQMTAPIIVIYKSRSNHTDGKKIRYSWNHKTGSIYE